MIHKCMTEKKKNKTPSTGTEIVFNYNARFTLIWAKKLVVSKEATENNTLQVV